MARLGARFLRPDRKGRVPPQRLARIGPAMLESVIWTCKGQLTLEAHGGRTVPGVCVRIAIRMLALAAGLTHNQQTGDPGRHFTAYGH